MAYNLINRDGGGDSGGGGTGGGAASGAAAAAPNQFVSGGITNIVGTKVKVATADVPVQCRAERLDNGVRVFIRPLPGNTKPVRVAKSAAACIFGPYDELPASDNETEFPVHNLGNIWVMQPTGAFVAGEGISVKARKTL